MAKFSPGWSCTAIITFCRHDSRLEQPHVLERAHHPHAGDLRRASSPTSSSPLSLTDPASGGMNAGEQVEHRRLAGAVRADERGDRALAELDVEVVGGDDAAEALATARSSRARPARRPTASARSASPLLSTGAPAVTVAVVLRNSCSARCSWRLGVCRHPALGDHLDPPGERPRSPRSHRHEREALRQERPAGAPASARRAARP